METQLRSCLYARELVEMSKLLDTNPHPAGFVQADIVGECSATVRDCRYFPLFGLCLSGYHTLIGSSLKL